VKTLLIILSILLLSSFITSCEKKEETLYRWGKYPPYVWKGFGDKETHPKYEGDVENGKPNGLGILIFPSGSKYVGSWKNGFFNDYGTLTYPDGRKYVGEHKNGKRNGQGIMTLPLGTKYVGEWKDNKRHGQGTITFSDGLGKYEGEYKDGKYWNGTMYDKDGIIKYNYVNGEWSSRHNKILPSQYSQISINTIHYLWNILWD